MKRFGAIALFGVAAVFHATTVVAGPPPGVVESARTSFIFVFTDDVPARDVPGLALGLTKTAAGRTRHIFTHAIKGFSASVPAHAAIQIARNPKIAYYEANGVAQAIAPLASKRPDNPGGGKPDKPGGGKPDKPKKDKPDNGGGDGGGDTPSGQQTPWGITRVGGNQDGSGRHAWVIDTGIDLAHGDLNVGSGDNFVGDGQTSGNDGNGHGTHVAGTIAALNNEIDVVGVAAGATVHPVRVLDNSGFGTIDGVVAGVDYVAANALSGDVANMSLTAAGHWQSLHDAVVNAASQGIRFAIAAGNDDNYAAYYEPADVEHPNVFTVSATDSSDRFASFSNWGNPPVDFAAPGVGVLSTRRGGGTTSLSGTSMAAPHVAGILLLRAAPNSDGVASGDPDGVADPIAHH